MKYDGKRRSGIELYRSFLMLNIIAYHYIVNSGVGSLFDKDHLCVRMIFLQLIGFGGKMAISGFTLITGYFMCQKEWSVKRIIKLLLPIKIYTIGAYLLFLATGYTIFDWKIALTYLFSICYGSSTNYISAVVWLYLLTPFINILIKGMSQKQYKILLILLFTYFTVIPTMIINMDNFSLLWWMVTVYLLGGYLKLYTPKWAGGGQNPKMVLHYHFDAGTVLAQHCFD